MAADVCAVLGISNNRDAMSRLDEDEKGVGSTDTLGGVQQLATINESGLYSLILGSRKPEAKRFKKWVTAEVLPSIRKTGHHGAPPQPLVPSGTTGVTMTGLELVDFISSQRGPGEAELRHDHFMAKVPKVLGEQAAPKFRDSYTGRYGTSRPYCRLPRREACPPDAQTSVGDDEKGVHSVDTLAGEVRAERRCGELLARTEKNTGAKGAGPIAVERYDRNTPTLAQIGLTKDESSRYQQLAAKSTARSATVFIVSEDTRHGQVSELFTGPTSLPISTGPADRCHLHVGADRSHLLRPENFTF